MQSANRYELKGNKSAITFGQNFAGLPSMTYNGKAYNRVSVQHTVAGVMASATIEVEPDRYTKELSVLIPTVHLKDNGAKSPVKTLAIFSTHRTSLIGSNAVLGQVIEYEVEELSGTASFVMS
jgi:hypothetical protein